MISLPGGGEPPQRLNLTRNFSGIRYILRKERTHEREKRQKIKISTGNSFPAMIGEPVETVEGAA